MNRKFSGLLWKILQQYSSYIIRLIIQIALARILMPSEYGIIAEMLVFLAFADIIANNAFGAAIIRKQDADELDYSSALVGSIFLGTLLYLIIFIAAPFIARFYNQNILTSLLRVYGISIFLSLYSSLLYAKLIKKYDLKSSFWASIISGTLSGIIAIIVAKHGLGVLALVVQNLLNSILTIIVLQFYLRWKPIIQVSTVRLKELFSFSWKYLLAMLMGNFLENAYNLSIGKVFGDEALGYYNRGNSFPSIIVGQLRTAIATLMLPYFSEKQNNKECFKDTLRLTTHLNALIMFPMAAGLAIVARPLVLVLLTEKWLPCVFFLQIECLFYAALAVSSPLSTCISALGESGKLAKIEGFKLLITIIGIAVLLLLKKGIYALCIFRAVVSLITIFISLLAVRKTLDYNAKDMLEDIAKPLILTAFMSAAVIGLGEIRTNIIVSLIIQCTGGVLVYSCGIWLLSREDIIMVKSIIHNKQKE